MHGYYVYCLTFPDGKRYVGMTYDVEKRWNNGNGYHCSHFFDEIKRVGWHNIKKEILYSNLSIQEAEEIERAVIAEFQTADPEKGYNIAKGGAYAGRHTEETKKKISQAEALKIKSDIHRKHLSESKQGTRHPQARPVYQYSKLGILIKKWDYMNEAAKTLGIERGTISAVCHGHRKSAAGFIWTYEERGR